MANREWIHFFSDECHILVRAEIVRGRIKSFAVVLLGDFPGRVECITRYDTAHGLAHRDVIGRTAGLIRKDWLIHLTVDDAISYALRDLKENHEQYLQFFLQN